MAAPIRTSFEFDSLAIEEDELQDVAANDLVLQNDLSNSAESEESVFVLAKQLAHLIQSTALPESVPSTNSAMPVSCQAISLGVDQSAPVTRNSQ